MNMCLRGIVGLLLTASLLAACGSHGRSDGRAELRAALVNHGLRARIEDRTDGLVGVPVVDGCDPPLITARRGDDSQGFLTLYVCRDSAQAQRAVILVGFPGQRYRIGRVVIVSNAGTTLTHQVRDVTEAVEARG